MKNHFLYDEFVRVPMKLVKHPLLNGSEKMVAIALVFFKEERKMKPSFKMLTAYTGLSPASVKNGIKGLEEKQLIKVMRNGTRINTYELHF